MIKVTRTQFEMAAPAPSDKVKGKEYSNWLKVTLALYYMKSGLHTFIQSEVDCLHQSLVQKIYGGQTVPLPSCTMCHASHVIRNKYNGVWTFPNQCRSYCDVWLYELLKHHTNPKSEKIYWDNSHVPSWPFKPWECAKVFMPKGQSPSSAGPNECDAQALLTLLASCTHFHHKLSPQGQGLTHTISTIRNKVMHDGEMEISDADRMSFIQQIILLLEDHVHLKSLDDCKMAVSNIHKINNDSVDVFFNLGLEMTALRAVVNDLRQETGMQDKKIVESVDFLKEECRQLREQLTKRFEDVEKELELHRERLGAFEENAELHGERLGAVEENVELHKERFGAVEENVELHGVRLGAVEENVLLHGGRLGAVEENIELQGERLGAVEENVELHEGRLGTVEEEVVKLQKVEENVGKLKEEIGQLTRKNNSCINDVPTKRRPESDGLRQLKSSIPQHLPSPGFDDQTEDNLDTFRKMGFIPTTQTEETKKLLQEKRSVVIKGNPGEGKTSTALHLIDNNDYRNQRVVVSSPKQWNKVDTDCIKIVLLEDIFGKYDLDPGRLQEWIDEYLETIQKHVDVGKLQVIITIRDDILLKAYSKLKSFKLFFSDMSLTLSSEKLKNSDKMSILNRELKRNNKDMNVDEQQQCIANFSGLIGFPQCCSLFAGDKDLFGQGPKFFKSPEKFLVDNITNLKPNSFLSLAFLFCIGEIEEEYLSPSQIKKSNNYLPVLENLALYLNDSFNESTVISLRKSYDHLSGLYVKRLFLYEHHSGGNVNKSFIQFSHATVYEAVGQVLGNRCPEMVVKYGELGYLYQRTYTAKAKENTSQNVFIPVSVYGLLVERMVHDVVERRLVQRVVNHSAFKQHQFLMTLKDELHKGSRIRDFIMAEMSHAVILPFHQSFGKDLSEGECFRFLQYILQSDEDLVRLVYCHFMEVLACTHNNNSCDCWKCEEKQNLLELALYYHHFEIAEKLITMNACYTHVSLCNAARHVDLSRVQTILEDLKRSLVFNPECTEAKKALYRAYISGNQDVIELLLQERIILDSISVVHAVQHGDMNVLMKVVEHLKCHNKWDPHREQCWKNEYFCLPDMHSGKFILIQHLTPRKQYSKFIFHDVHLNTFRSDLYFDVLVQIPCSTALYIAYFNEKFDMADYLMKNEVKVSLDMLPCVSEYSSQQAVARMIQNLKVTGIWDPLCDDASEALVMAYGKKEYDRCDLLNQEGVSLTMKNIPVVVGILNISLEYVKKAIQQLKDTKSWNPKCDDASEALERAYVAENQDVCDLLIQEGVSLSMKNLPGVVGRFKMSSLESVKKAIQHLKDTDSWDPKSDDASKTLEKAYREQKCDVCDQLVKEGVSITMKHLPDMILRSLDYVKTEMKQLKDNDIWDPKCDDASKALANAYMQRKYDVCDLLIKEGVSLTMTNFLHVMMGYYVSLESVMKAIKHLKDANTWDYKGDCTSKALEKAYSNSQYDMCDLLIHEGASLKMKNLPGIIICTPLGGSLEPVKKAIQHLKVTNTWDHLDDYASEALVAAYMLQKYDWCDLLILEGVSLK